MRCWLSWSGPVGGHALPSSGDPRRDTAAFWEAGDSPPPTHRPVGITRCLSSTRVCACSVSRAAGGPDEGRSVTGWAVSSGQSSLPPPRCPARRPLESHEVLRPGPDPVWLVLSEKSEKDSNAHRDDHVRTRKKARLTRGRSSSGASPQTRVLGGWAALRPLWCWD